MHHDDAIDVVAELTIDPDDLPDDVRVTDRVLTGLVARQDAIEGRCSGCWSEPVMLNREGRRRMWPGQKAQFEGYVRHGSTCPAQDRAVRQWLYTHRRLV